MHGVATAWYIPKIHTYIHVAEWKTTRPSATAPKAQDNPPSDGDICFQRDIDIQAMCLSKWNVKMKMKMKNGIEDGIQDILARSAIQAGRNGGYG